MLKNALTRRGFLAGAAAATAATATTALSGCGSTAQDGRVPIEIVSYKQEATEIFAKVQEDFNAANDHIRLTISSPHDATTIMRTRFVRSDYPDIIGIGGDATFSEFVDAGILTDVSSFDGISKVKKGYLDILNSLTYVPMPGIYGVPYVANAAGILYNRTMFQEHGWDTPEDWGSFIALCDAIKAEGIQPLYFGFRDTWTCLAPWNALAVELCPEDLCLQVNEGKAKFADYLREPAEKLRTMLDYAEEGPFAYAYNDACTAFANGQSAMYPIGSYAIPQILSVNPDMDIDSFVMPATDTPDGRKLNSGVDLQFCVCDACPHKEEAFEVIDYLLSEDIIQTYIDDQTAVPCTEGEFTLTPMLDGMRSFIEEGNVVDFQDHHYPAAMAVDAQIQTYLLGGDVDAFMQKFDTDWQRYNRDIIRKVQEYNQSQQ